MARGQRDRHAIPLEVALRTLDRHFWLARALTLAVVSALLGRGAARWIEARYLLTQPSPARRVRTGDPPTGGIARSKDAAAVLRRNLFCSTCPPLVEVPAAAATTEDDAPTKTDLPVSLIATLATEDTTMSLAILRDGDTRRTGAYRAGALLRWGVRGDHVEERRVYLRKEDGRLTYLDLPEAARGAATQATPIPAAPADRDLDTGIRRLANGRYTIQRSLLDKLLGDMNGLARTARIIPASANGRATGFRFVAIRPNTFYARIGLQNGDVVRAINGHEMTSPDRALDVYSKLRSASHLNLAVLRGAQPINIDYDIVVR